MAKQKKQYDLKTKQKIYNEIPINGMDKTATKYGVHFSTIYAWAKQYGWPKHDKNVKKKSTVKIIKGDDGDGLIVEHGKPRVYNNTRSAQIAYPITFNTILNLEVDDSATFNTEQKGKIVKICRDAVKKRYPERNFSTFRLDKELSCIWRDPDNLKPKRKYKTNQQHKIGNV